MVPSVDCEGKNNGRHHMIHSLWNIFLLSSNAVRSQDCIPFQILLQVIGVAMSLKGNCEHVQICFMYISRILMFDMNNECFLKIR